jgi:ABC-2 type transport system permease protein
VLLRPLSFALPLIYGADTLHAGVHRQSQLPPWLDFRVLAAFCGVLFAVRLRNIKKK